MRRGGGALALGMASKIRLNSNLLGAVKTDPIVVILAPIHGKRLGCSSSCQQAHEVLLIGDPHPLEGQRACSAYIGDIAGRWCGCSENSRCREATASSCRWCSEMARGICILLLAKLVIAIDAAARIHCFRCATL